MIRVASRAGAGSRELAAEASVALADVLFVGDRPEDKQAAAAAGVSFRWAEDFFGTSDGE